MERGNLSRRGFMQRSLAAMAATGVPAWFGREVLAEEEAAKNKAAAPSSRINIGLIACGSRMGQLVRGDLRPFRKQVEIVACCDVDRGRRESMAKRIGKECKSYEDYRELLEHKGIDAVLIATPDHWHTLPVIAALRKKKDVYCEKPLTLTIEEGKGLVKVAKDTGQIFQVGSQQRSAYGGKFRLACELVRNGRIGKLKTIRTLVGKNPVGGPFPVAPVPDGLNWDFWLGQTPKVPYVAKRCHYQFRWWYEYSGGKMTDWGAHHNDIAQWALDMDKSGPVAVKSKGTDPSKKPNSYNCHPTFEITYTYDNGVELICNSDSNGVKFEGEDGKWIFVSRGKLDASDKKLLDSKLPPDAVRLYKSTNHMGNFLEGVRTRKPCICPAEVGHRSVSVCHLGVISLRMGYKDLKWDPAKEEFVGNEDANKMLSRTMRAPWKLDV